MPKRHQYFSDIEQIISEGSDGEIDSRDDGAEDAPDPSLLESGTEWIFQGNLIAEFDEHPDHEADSPETLRLIVETWNDFYFPKYPAKIDYLVMFNDTSGNHFKYNRESKIYRLIYNVRVYIQGQSVTLAQLENWIQQPVQWSKASGIPLMDWYVMDMNNASDPSSTVRILLTSGKRREFRLRSIAWSFNGSIRLGATSLQDDADLQDVVLEKFGDICTIPIPDIQQALARRPTSLCNAESDIGQAGSRIRSFRFAVLYRARESNCQH
jgi:hypothetical protein